MFIRYTKHCGKGAKTFALIVWTSRTGVCGGDELSRASFCAYYRRVSLSPLISERAKSGLKRSERF